MLDSSEKAKKLLQEQSPVPAWSHYDITRNVDVKIQAKLEASKHREYLIGLKIAYNVRNGGEEGSTYSMVFGKIDLPLAMKYPRVRNGKTQLTDKFLARLYQEVEVAIMDVMQGPGMPEVKMEVRTNFMYCSLPYRCLKIGQLWNGKRARCGGRLDSTGIRRYCPTGSQRICSEAATVWVCKHTKCS